MTIGRPPSSSEIVISILKPSFDGLYWGRYPNGDKPGPPGTFVAAAQATVTASGNLTGTAATLSGSASIGATVSGALSGGTSGGLMKFDGGHYGAYSTILANGTNFSGSEVQVELHATFAYPLVLGYLLAPTWAYLEPVQGETDTSSTYPQGYATGMGRLKSILDYARAATPSKRIALKIILGAYTQTHPGAGDYSIIPQYVQTNPAYGAAGYRVSGTVTNASQHGWWGGDGNGHTYACCFHRAAIRDRLIKLVQAILTYFDGDPILESLQFDEDSFVIGASSTNACPDWNNTNFINNAANLIQTLNTGTRATPISWEATYSGTATFTQQIIATATANRTDWSGTDTLGQTYVNAHGGQPYTWGASIMCGFTAGGSNPAVNYRDEGYALFPEVEGSDMGAFGYFGGGYTPADILTCLNTTLKAKKAFWGIMLPGGNWGNVQPNATWDKLGPFLNTASNALTNTARPVNYL